MKVDGMSGRQAKIVVIGSYAVGMTMGCARFPREGETVMGRGFQILHGGKGSNQAIAVARLGGAVTFGGAVGKDLSETLPWPCCGKKGIDTTFVKRMDGIATGVGIVIVAESGNNEIVIDLGANNHLLPADIEGMRSAIASADLLLVQLGGQRRGGYPGNRSGSPGGDARHIEPSALPEAA